MVWQLLMTLLLELAVVCPLAALIWMNSSAPAGWFKLQGGTFDINQYPQLHAYLERTAGYSSRLPSWAVITPVSMATTWLTPLAQRWDTGLRGQRAGSPGITPTLFRMAIPELSMQRVAQTLTQTVLPALLLRAGTTQPDLRPSSSITSSNTTEPKIHVRQDRHGIQFTPTGDKITLTTASGSLRVLKCYRPVYKQQMLRPNRA